MKVFAVEALRLVLLANMCSDLPRAASTVSNRQAFPTFFFFWTVRFQVHRGMPVHFFEQTLGHLTCLYYVHYSTRQHLITSYFNSVSRLISSPISAEVLESKFLLGGEVQNAKLLIFEKTYLHRRSMRPLFFSSGYQECFFSPHGIDHS